MQTIRQGLNVHTDNLSSLANKDIQVNSGVVQKYETSTGSVTIKQGVDVYVVTPTNNAVTVTIPSGLGMDNYVRTLEIIIHNASNTNSNTVTISQTGYSVAYGYTSYTFTTNLVLNVSILGTLLIIRSSDDVVGRAVADSVGNPILTTYAKKTDVVNKSTQLTDIQDLNTIKTEGIYDQRYNANATAANHYPVTLAGSLVVLKNCANGADGCTQLYYPYETQVQYQRKYLVSSTSWTPWDTGVNSLMRNTAYKVGDIAYSPNLPSWAYLECITAGTTGDTEPDFSTVGGGAIVDITDGVVHWKIRDERLVYMINLIHPVGSIWETTTTDDPNTLWAGTTWVKMDAGRVLVSAGSYTENGTTYTYNLGDKGGVAKCQLTIKELAAHSHNIANAGDHTHLIANTQTSDGGGLTSKNYLIKKCTWNSYENFELIGSNAAPSIGLTSSSGSHTHSIASTGGNKPHENRQPYLVINRWQRTK